MQFRDIARNVHNVNSRCVENVVGVILRYS